MTHLLLVEDDHLTAEFAIETMHRVRPTWTLVHVASLAEALVATRETPVSAVLLDLELPDADGVEAVIALRAITAVPVVVVSGRGELFAEALKKGANAAFGKLEFDLGDALSYLDGHLDGTR